MGLTTDNPPIVAQTVSNQQQDAREVLAGLVELVTFHNPDNGFCILRIKARGHRDLVTTIGHAASVSAGEWATASGEWVNDRTHGQQLKAHFLRISAPTSLDGIERYLDSGTIKRLLDGESPSRESSGTLFARRL